MFHGCSTQVQHIILNISQKLQHSIYIFFFFQITWKIDRRWIRGNIVNVVVCRS